MTITFIAVQSSGTTPLKRSSKWHRKSPNRDPQTSLNSSAKSRPAQVFGNIDASDLKPPQLKLLAGQSPEVLDGVPGALPGEFLDHNFEPKSWSEQVIGSPILLRKSYQVWAPKTPGSDQKGPLATASDGINWDVPNQTFEVKFLGNPRTYTWKLGRTVTETGAHKFGSSQDDDKSI